MKSLILACTLVGALAIQATVGFELSIDQFGKKAYEIDYSDAETNELEGEFKTKGKQDSVERVLAATKIIEGRAGCTWSRFGELLDLLEKEKSHPVPILIKIAIHRQFAACKSEVIDLPTDDGLSVEERDSLVEFGKRIKLEKYDDPKLMAMNVLAFLKEDRSLTFKHIKKNDNERMEFRAIFFKQMRFCFTVDAKLRHYFEFADQITEPWTFGIRFAGDMKPIADRVQLGLICRAFVDKNQKIEELAFKKTMGKWYNFKKAFKEITSDDEE